MTLHHNFRPMTNTELSLHQLTAISGGGVFAKLGDIRPDYHLQTQGNSDDSPNVTVDGDGSVDGWIRITGSANPDGDDI